MKILRQTHQIWTRANKIANSQNIDIDIFQQIFDTLHNIASSFHPHCSNEVGFGDLHLTAPPNCHSMIDRNDTEHRF
jgi:hypothetical protein